MLGRHLPGHPDEPGVPRARDAAQPRPRARPRLDRGRRRRAAARRDGDPPRRRALCRRSRGGPCSPVRSRSWRARACATRRRWAASSPTPTTPRTRRRADRAGGAGREACAPRARRGHGRAGFAATATDPASPTTSCSSRCAACPERAVCGSSARASAEDRPCVAVAAVRGDAGLRVVVGAVAGRPQELPEVCPRRRGGRDRAGLCRGDRADERLARQRGYRRRVIGVEVRRALEALG